MKRALLIVVLLAGCGDEKGEPAPPTTVGGMTVQTAGMDPNRAQPPHPGPNEVSRTTPRNPAPAQ